MKKTVYTAPLLLGALISSGISAELRFPASEWQEITAFPKGFIFGAGHSHLQYEGKRPGYEEFDTNSWHLLEELHTPENPQPNVKELCGDACKGWQLATEDVDLIYDIGFGGYRFSISWEKVNPGPGVFDLDAIDHYKKVLDTCNKKGIKVLLGLHHYTDPAWFTRLGGWTKRENIPYFVEYAQKMYEAFGDRVWHWATFNSAAGAPAKCFITGEMIAAIDSNGTPVMHKNDFAGHMNMFCNICLAHVETYVGIKDMYNSMQQQENHTKNPHIGTLHNILQIDAVHYWDCLATKLIDNILEKPLYKFFTTGYFPDYLGMYNLAYDERAPYSLDFIGLNYYSHKKICNFKPSNYEEDIPTQNQNYTIYPEGLYEAIHSINEKLVKPVSAIQGKDIPLYVAENGIAAINPEDREIFFKRYMYALHKAIDDGVNVKGYFTWSLLDNYEWGTYSKQYGLYHVDFNDPQRTRTLKPDAGTHYIVRLAQNTKIDRGVKV